MSNRSRQTHVFGAAERAYIRSEISAMCSDCSPRVKVAAGGDVAVAHAPSCSNLPAIVARGEEIAGQDLRRFPGEPVGQWAERIVMGARRVIAGAS